MRIAILSDAHGNKIFFDKCIEKINTLSINKIFCLGDIFGYLYDGKYILDRLRGMNAIILKGNHEAMLCDELPIDPKKDAIYGLLDQKSSLSHNDLLYLMSLGNKYEVIINGKSFLFLHGAPYDALCGYLYENDVEYSGEEDYHYIFMGHTHRPYIRKRGRTVFVNVGSCGLPRDIGLEPSFCIYDTDKQVVELVRCKMNEDILEDMYFKGLDERILNVFRRKKDDEY